MGKGHQIELIEELRFPHSLGLLYSAFTYYTGFRVNSGEYKMMGLAPYGKPRFKDLILTHLIDLREDGSFWLDMRYFDYCAGLRMTNRRFHRLFGHPPRRPDDPITEPYIDVAASIQAVTEEIMLRLARRAHAVTGEKAVCLAGGVALNCVANGRLLREGPFADVWVQPAAGDAGGALGAALTTWYQLLGNERVTRSGDSQLGSLLGPSFSGQQVRQTLDELGAKYHAVGDAQAIDATVALLAEGKVVGWFDGRMEFGPRALGSRSILADPRDEGIQSRVNLKIKFRESFRPFAPVVLKERCSDYFDIDRESPYMLFVAPVTDALRTAASDDSEGADLLDRLHTVRSEIPAVTHVDFSARVQTCDAERHPRLHRLIRAFDEQTGCGLLLNTSFNVRGEPIVCTPADAYACFMRTDMDALIFAGVVLHKDEQPPFSEPRARFQPD